MVKASRLEVLAKAAVQDLDIAVRAIGDQMPSEELAARVLRDLQLLRKIRAQAQNQGMDRVEMICIAAEDLVVEIPGSWLAAAINPIAGLVVLKARFN